jgi:hypothetical protein
MRIRPKPLNQWALCAWPDVHRADAEGGPRLLIMSPRGGPSLLDRAVQDYGLKITAKEDGGVVAVCPWGWFGDPLKHMLATGALCFAIDRAEFVQEVCVQRERLAQGWSP